MLVALDNWSVTLDWQGKASLIVGSFLLAYTWVENCRLVATQIRQLIGA